MRKRWTDRRFLAFLVILSLTLIAAAPAQGYTPPHDDPGPATDTIYFRAFDVDRASQDLQAGEMDIYFFNLKTAAAREIRNVSGVKLYQAPATTLSLILNPAPGGAGELNPFSLPKVREAMQYLVNRDFIANEIYQGLGQPMTTHVSPSDFDFLTVFDLVRERNFFYDPEFAVQLIDEAMIDAGAEKVEGVWNFEGRPVRIKFIIRTEDERREIGDLVRAELEKAGFLVSPGYQQFAPAIQAVYSSDPSLLQWHIYTEGWGRSSPQRYDFANINQMAAPWLGNMPGWQEVGFWQYKNEQLDEIGQKLFTGDFASLEERNVLYRDMTATAMDESVRIWIATVMNSFPAVDTLQGVTQDLVAGPKAPWTLREAYIPGQDIITVGNLWVWTARTTWNPVGGFGDVYSADIWGNLYDPPIRNHPSTGVPIPFRATYEVQTAGPTDKLDVPADAVMWDVSGNQWAEVGGSVRATSKITYDYTKYFDAKWHHGIPITIADVLYSIQQGFEISFDADKSRIEFALGVTSRPYLNTFKGYRILDDNRLEVYIDFWHFVDDQIASFASPAGLSTPWELLAVMDSLVFEQRKAAYSDTAAARFQVPWLSLSIRTDANLVRRATREFLQDGVFPASVFTVGGTTYSTEAEAQARYQAILDWYEEHEMLVISNGPYTLERYDPPAQFAELSAYRDPSYPFKPGDWHFGAPDLISIGQVRADPLEIGSSAEINVSVSGPGDLGLRYQVVDPATGKVLKAADAPRIGDTDFTITLDAEFTSGLAPGLYKIYLASFSDEIARLAERQLDVEAFPAGTAPQQPSGQDGTQPTPTPTSGTSGGCGLSRAADGSSSIEGMYLLGGLAVLGMVVRRRRNR